MQAHAILSTCTYAPDQCDRWKYPSLGVDLSDWGAPQSERSTPQGSISDDQMHRTKASRSVDERAKLQNTHRQIWGTLIEREGVVVFLIAGLPRVNHCGCLASANDETWSNRSETYFDDLVDQNVSITQWEGNSKKVESIMAAHVFCKRIMMQRGNT